MKPKNPLFRRAQRAASLALCLVLLQGQEDCPGGSGEGASSETKIDFQEFACPELRNQVALNPYGRPDGVEWSEASLHICARIKQPADVTVGPDGKVAATVPSVSIGFHENPLAPELRDVQLGTSSWGVESDDLAPGWRTICFDPKYLSGAFTGYRASALRGAFNYQPDRNGDGLVDSIDSKKQVTLAAQASLKGLACRVRTITESDGYRRSSLYIDLDLELDFTAPPSSSTELDEQLAMLLLRKHLQNSTGGGMPREAIARQAPRAERSEPKLLKESGSLPARRDAKKAAATL